MSDQALESIRTMNEAVAGGDMEVLSGLLHPDVVWEHNIGGGSPEEGLYRGREAVVRLFERFLEPWQYMRPEPLEVRELEDRSHLVTGEVRAKHRTSDLEVVTPYEQRLEIRDGLVVKSQLTFGEAGNMSRNTHEHTRQEET